MNHSTTVSLSPLTPAQMEGSPEGGSALPCMKWYPPLLCEESPCVDVGGQTAECSVDIIREIHIPGCAIA